MVFVMRKTTFFALFFLLLSPAFAADQAQELVAAAMSGRVETLRDLLAQGADANSKNAAGRPALLLAAFNGNLHSVRALVSAGADVDLVDAKGATALMQAASFNHPRWLPC